jgi:hypothetical protein
MIPRWLKNPAAGAKARRRIKMDAGQVMANGSILVTAS